MRANGSSTVVEHLPLYPKVKGSSTAACMGSEKMAKSLGSGMHANGSSTMDEQSPCHPKVNGQV